ncbi:MAG: hypothetical protein ABS897_10345, partial [Eubacteriales bacterium]
EDGDHQQQSRSAANGFQDHPENFQAELPPQPGHPPPSRSKNVNGPIKHHPSLFVKAISAFSPFFVSFSRCLSE